MKGDRIIHFRADAARLQMRAHAVALRHPNHELVVDVSALG
jgi:hypothetical protein